MKKILFVSLAIMALCSCHQASELPPIDAKYAKEFILPDPVVLSDADRQQIKELQEEYNKAIRN